MNSKLDQLFKFLLGRGPDRVQSTSTDWTVDKHGNQVKLEELTGEISQGHIEISLDSRGSGGSVILNGKDISHLLEKLSIQSGVNEETSVILHMTNLRIDGEIESGILTLKGNDNDE